MYIRINHTHASLTDEWTGLVTSGGTIALASATPFTATAGQYARLTFTSANFLYAYRDVTEQEAAEIVQRGIVVFQWLARLPTLPPGDLDLCMMRTQASPVGVVWARLVKDGTNWKLRLYARRDDNTTAYADTASFAPSFWQAGVKIVITVNIGAAVEVGVVLYGVTGGLPELGSATLTGINNDTMMARVTRFSLGAPSVVAASGVYEFDQVVVQDMAYSTASREVMFPDPAGVVRGDDPWAWCW